jgi:hypothetical protein
MLALDRHSTLGEHQFDMEDLAVAPRLVHRTAHVQLRLTRHRADRCYRLLRSAGDVWAWLLDLNRQRLQRADPPVTGYPALCRELTAVGSFGELSIGGARSVLRRYADAWHEAAKRRTNGEHARFPRRKRALVPVRFYHGTFLIEGQRVRLPVRQGCPALWVRLARPIPYPAEQVRAVTLLHDGGRLWLAVTAAIPVQRHDLDPARVAGVDLGIIHPYAVVANGDGLLVSGRAIRAENYLHLRDQQARQAKAPAEPPDRASGARVAGGAIGRGCAGWRRAIAAAFTRPSMRPLSRSSPSRCSSRPGSCWWATPLALPNGTPVGPTTCGCSSGAAPTLCRRSRTRPSKRAS